MKNYFYNQVDNKTVKKVKQDYFEEFSKYHSIWLRELVAKYKEHGLFPVFPTQIIEYYPNDADKEIAIFSTLCMNWKENELEQIASMRQILGQEPAKWFSNREFVLISVGREQMNTIEGYSKGFYWKIAKMYDILYDLCYDGYELTPPSKVFKKANSFSKFCMEVENVCELDDVEYKQRVIELVLRTSDGIGRNLWPTTPSKVKCPNSVALRKYMKSWFPDWSRKMWPWDEAVKLYNLEHDYDFFYSWLAYKELARLYPLACKQYTTRYQKRWESGMCFAPRDWRIKDRGRQPEINFDLL